QLLGRDEQMLVHDLDLGQNRHEVGVAVPTGHYVKVQMVGDARAGGAAEVGADVEPFGFERSTQNGDRVRKGAHEVGRLPFVERVELALVDGGRDHHVPRVVRELV